jgi:hypothetical protein
MSLKIQVFWRVLTLWCWVNIFRPSEYCAFFFRPKHFWGMTIPNPESRGVTIIRNVETYLFPDTVCHAVGLEP